MSHTVGNHAMSNDPSRSSKVVDFSTDRKHVGNFISGAGS